MQIFIKVKSFSGIDWNPFFANLENNINKNNIRKTNTFFDSVHI